MTSAAVISLICGLIWSVLLYFAIRHRDGWTIVAALLALVVNLFLGNGWLLAGNITRVWSTGLVTLLLIDRLNQSPEHVKHVITAQLVDARAELHHERADRASWEARAVTYRRLLEKHRIDI